MLTEQQTASPRKRNSETGRSPLKNGNVSSPQKSPKSSGKVGKVVKKEVVKKLTPEQLKEL
jgi:hypothetical protein